MTKLVVITCDLCGYESANQSPIVLHREPTPKGSIIGGFSADDNGEHHICQHCVRSAVLLANDKGIID